MQSSLWGILFKFDEFAMLMIALVLCVGLCVGSFATRYLQGDARYNAFFKHLLLLILSLVITVSTNNLIILFLFCCLNHIILVRLMLHKSSWQAAWASARLASKNYMLSAVFMGAAYSLFYFITGSSSINTIVQQNADSPAMLGALILLTIAAMAQSAIWPFHRWLLSSLNSPTPVSAIMHAGLINGGGFILVRFATLYLQHNTLLTIIFTIGLITALLGTLWKLLQNDVKRMLACSTMGQMGFMLVQCGLGLFPAAVAHLIWHGMFKAYLFLASGSVAQEKRFEFAYPPTTSSFIAALLCGFIGSLGFGYISSKSWSAFDTTLVLLSVAFITASQLVLPILQTNILLKLPLALLIALIAGCGYGASVEIIAWLMEPMQLMQPKPLNFCHMIAIALLAISWLAMLFELKQVNIFNFAAWWRKYYVIALNASQPHQTTVTSHRNHYKYQ